MIHYLSFISVISALFICTSVQAASLAHYDEAGLSRYSIDDLEWRGLTRNDVFEFTKNVADEPRSLVIRELSRSILLSESDFGDLDEAEDADATLTEVRAKKLVNMGEYHLAIELIQSEGKKLPDPNLVTLFVKLLIFTGQSPVACVETNIAIKKFSAHSGLKDLAAYCHYRYGKKNTVKDKEDAMLKDIQDPIIRKALIDVDLSYKPTSKNELTEMPAYRLAVLSDMGRIDLSKYKRDYFAQLPSSHIIPLLQSSRLSDGDRSAILLLGVSRGIVPSLEALEFYKGFYDAEDIVTYKSDSAEHTQLASLLHLWLKSENEDVANDIIKKVVAFDKSNPGALRIFLSLVSDGDISLKGFTKNWNIVLPILIIDNLSMARRLIKSKIDELEVAWSDIDTKKDERERFFRSNSAFFSIAIVYDLLPTNISNNYVKYLRTDVVNTKTSSESSDLYIKIVSALDKEVAFDDNPASIYEKHKANSALQHTNYPMPNGAVWDVITKSTDRNESGLFIFTCLELLQRQEEKYMYPLLLNDIIRGLVNVGNKEMAYKVATHTIIGR